MRLVVVVVALVACGSSGTTPIDASIDTVVSQDDGTPMRRACTNQLGTALTSVYGRLDGILVSIVQPGGGGCNADSDHVHLQVLANNMTYDIAVNVGSSGVDDVHTKTLDVAFATWSEGWHTDVLTDYVALGVHSSDIPIEPRAQIASELTADLATANHISIFGTGYGPDGAHLIHRNGNGHDGLVLTKPLSNPAHARLFSFTSQTF